MSLPPSGPYRVTVLSVGTKSFEFRYRVSVSSVCIDISSVSIEYRYPVSSVGIMSFELWYRVSASIYRVSVPSVD